MQFMEPRVINQNNSKLNSNKKEELSEGEIFCDFFQSVKKLGEICIVCKNCKKIISYDSYALLLNASKTNVVICDDLAIANATISKDFKTDCFRTKKSLVKFVYKEISCLSCKLKIGKFVSSSSDSKFLLKKLNKNTNYKTKASNNSLIASKISIINFKHKPIQDNNTSTIYHCEELRNFIKQNFEFSSMNNKCLINEECILYYDTNLYSQKRVSRLLDSLDSCFRSNKDQIDRVRNLFLPEEYCQENKEGVIISDKFYKEYLKLCSTIQYIVSPIKMKLAFYNLFEKVFFEVDKKIKIIVIAAVKFFNKIKKIAENKNVSTVSTSENLKLLNDSIKEIESQINN